MRPRVIIQSVLGAGAIRFDLIKLWDNEESVGGERPRANWYSRRRARDYQYSAGAARIKMRSRRRNLTLTWRWDRSLEIQAAKCGRAGPRGPPARLPPPGAYALQMPNEIPLFVIVPGPRHERGIVNVLCVCERRRRTHTRTILFSSINLQRDVELSWVGPVAKGLVEFACFRSLLHARDGKTRISNT